MNLYNLYKAIIGIFMVILYHPVLVVITKVMSSS